MNEFDGMDMNTNENDAPLQHEAGSENMQVEAVAEHVVVEAIEAVAEYTAAEVQAERAAEAAALPPLETTTAGSQEPFYKEEIRNETAKRRNSRFKSLAALVCAASLIGGTSLGLGIGIGVPLANNYFLPRLLDDSEQIKNFSFPEQAQQVGSFSGQYSVPSYADIVAKVEPATVIITSKVKGERDYAFFSAPYEGEGAGTGILFGETDVNYLIATNAHVIDGAESVQVSIAGSDGISAKPVGKDTQADLAVISVSKADVQRAGVKNVTLATFGNSDSMQMGDIVLAIGNSLGNGNIATNGIISSGEKEITVDGLNLTVLQTNAAINSGNSGGPLVNLNGEVIGINTAKLTQMANTSVEGTGYTIPSNVAVPILQSLMAKKGKPVIGIGGDTISEIQAQQYNLPQAGVIVGYVEPSYPAEKAGIQANDIITGIDSEPVMTMEQLQEIMTRYKVGDKIDVKIIRNGKEFLTLKVTLAENKLESF